MSCKLLNLHDWQELHTGLYWCKECGALQTSTGIKIPQNSKPGIKAEHGDITDIATGLKAEHGGITDVDMGIMQESIDKIDLELVDLRKRMGHRQPNPKAIEKAQRDNIKNSL